MIDPTFRYSLFVLSFKFGRNVALRNAFNRHYLSFVEIKDFNVLIDNKPFFDQPIKNKQEAYVKFVEMSRNDDHTTGNISNYLYHQKCYKFTGINLSRQTNTSIRL